MPSLFVPELLVEAGFCSYQGVHISLTNVLFYPLRDELSLSGITQFYIDTGGEEWKFETLTDIFASVCVPQTVVFVNTRRKVDWLAERLKRDGFTVTAAHGDMDQGARDSVMKQFRAGRRYVYRFFSGS